MSMGVGGSSRGGRGVAAAAAEVVDDATKLTPGRLPPKHEAIPEGDGGEDSRSRHRLH